VSFQHFRAPLGCLLITTKGNHRSLSVGPQATVPITSRYDGKIVKLYYEEGDTAKTGDPLVDIDVDGLFCLLRERAF
jgi:hypothetical protein